MIFQQKKKNLTNHNKNQGWIFDPDYNHFKKIDQQPKRTKILKNANKNIGGSDIKFSHPNLLPKIEFQRLSTQSSEVVVLFDKYRILPMTEKEHAMKNRNFSGKCRQRIGLTQKAKYKRLHKTTKIIKNNRTYNLQLEIQNKSSNNYNNLKSQYNISSNENQRAVHEVQDHTKVTHCSNSTKTPSQAFHRSYKQSPQSNTGHKLRNKVKFSESAIKISNNLKIAPDDILRNPIPQQHSSVASNSKTSKTNRNQSSISPNPNSKNSKVNLTNSNRSMYKSSLFLPVNSIKISGQLEHLSQLEGYSIIQDFIQYLNVLANYAQQITDYYENTDDWQELIFLMYKKYYLSRLKLFNALFYRGNPKINHSSDKIIKKFYEQLEWIITTKINIQVEWENWRKFKEYLQPSHIEVWQLHQSVTNRQFFMLDFQAYNGNYHAEPDLVKNRLKTILKCGITITVLDKKVQEQKELNRFLKTPINIEVFENLINFIRQKLI